MTEYDYILLQLVINAIFVRSVSMQKTQIYYIINTKNLILTIIRESRENVFALSN